MLPLRQAVVIVSKVTVDAKVLAYLSNPRTRAVPLRLDLVLRSARLVCVRIGPSLLCILMQFLVIHPGSICPTHGLEE